MSTALAIVRPGLRLVTGILLSVVLGFAVTLITGELALSWDYLLLDIPLIAVCAVFGFKVMRAWRVHSAADLGVGSSG